MLRFVFFVLFIASTSYANEVDNLNALPATDYCNRLGEMYWRGGTARIHGFNRVIEAPTTEDLQLIKHHMNLSVGNIRSLEWNRFDDQEKAELQKWTFMGWDAANDLIVNGVKLTIEEFNNTTNSWVYGCNEARRKARL